MFQRILVGTDGSGTAGAAVAHAVELAKIGGSELIVVSAYKQPEDVPPPFGEAEGHHTAEIGKAILSDQVPSAALNSAVFAITLEPEGGVKAPTGPIYLVSAS